MSKIEVNNLTKDYGHGRGVFDVSFKIDEGEVFGFLGPNGAGKSTTIRHLMGFGKPDSGNTRILGLESFAQFDKFMSKVCYLPGEIALPSGLSGWQFINMMKKLKGVNDEKRLKMLLDYFEFNPSGETKKMSLGDKRKLAIVTAFLNDGEILILDEPTSGLDFEMQQKFIEFIKNEKSRGKTILLSSHIFSEVEATCDRIAIIKDGKIVNEFDSAMIKHKKEKVYQIDFKNAIDNENFVLSISSQKNFTLLSKQDKSSIITLDDKDVNKLINLLSQFDITDFHHLKESLEDYFMKFYC